VLHLVVRFTCLFFQTILRVKITHCVLFTTAYSGGQLVVALGRFAHTQVRSNRCEHTNGWEDLLKSLLLQVFLLICLFAFLELFQISNFTNCCPTQIVVGGETTPFQQRRTMKKNLTRNIIGHWRCITIVCVDKTCSALCRTILAASVFFC